MAHSSRSPGGGVTNSQPSLTLISGTIALTKGIKTFLEIASLYPEHKFFIFGTFDYSSKDCIDKSDFLKLSKKLEVNF